MVNKKRIEEYKESILSYLFRKGTLCNTYKVARELEIDRAEVLEILHELAEEGKVTLRSGSVKAITKELSGEEIVRTKSEVEELKEKVERLEKWVGTTFSQLREAVQIRPQKILGEDQAKEDSLDNSGNIKN